MQVVGGHGRATKVGWSGSVCFSRVCGPERRTSTFALPGRLVLTYRRLAPEFDPKVKSRKSLDLLRQGGPQMFLLWSWGLVRVVSYETPACTLAGRPGAACVAAFMLLRSRQTAGSMARELLSSPVCKWGNGQPGVTGSGGGRASVAGLAAAGTPLSSGVPRRPGQRAHCRGSASAAACRVGCCSLQTETCSHPSQCPTSLLLGQDLS